MKKSLAALLMIHSCLFFSVLSSHTREELHAMKKTELTKMFKDLYPAVPYGRFTKVQLINRILKKETPTSVSGMKQERTHTRPALEITDLDVFKLVATYGNDKQLKMLLESESINPRTLRDSNNRTLLHIAAEFNHPSYIQLLAPYMDGMIDAQTEGVGEIDVNASVLFYSGKVIPTCMEYTPLFAAVYFSNPGCVDALLNYGADPLLMTGVSTQLFPAISPLAYACLVNEESLFVSMLEKVPNVRVLVEHLKSVRLLEFLVKLGRTDIMETLFDYGIDPNSTYDFEHCNPILPRLSKCTIFEYAVLESYQPSVIKFLLQYSNTTDELMKDFPRNLFRVQIAPFMSDPSSFAAINPNVSQHSSKSPLQRLYDSFGKRGAGRGRSILKLFRGEEFSRSSNDLGEILLTLLAYEHVVVTRNDAKQIRALMEESVKAEKSNIHQSALFFTEEMRDRGDKLLRERGF